MPTPKKPSTGILLRDLRKPRKPQAQVFAEINQYREAHGINLSVDDVVGALREERYGS